MPRGSRSRKSAAAAAAVEEMENEAAAAGAAGTTTTQEVSKTVQSITDLIATLSKPADMLTTILLPSDGGDCDGRNDSNKEVASMLRSASRTLFSRLEELAALEERLKNKQSEEACDEDDASGETVNDCPLSGLAELYTGEGKEEEQEDDDQVMADAESVWGQVDLQNEALLPKLRKSVKSLSKKVVKEGASSIRLLDFGDLSDDEEGDDGGGGAASTSGSESGNDDADSAAVSDDDDDDEEDEDARRIRERMERTMADMSDEAMDDNDGKDEGRHTTNKPWVMDSSKDQDNEDEDLEDPAANELNDGFFDINEMEAFADEEEDYLPDDIGAEEEGEKKKKNQKANKLPHQRQREGNESSDSDDESGAEEPTVAKRKKYREDDEIDALYNLYQEANSDDEEDDDEEEVVVNMTAADFFGQPNKRYLRAKKGQDIGGSTSKNKSKGKSKSQATKKKIDEDMDSWDEHSFGDEEDGPGWRDEYYNKDENANGDVDKVDESSDEGDGEESDEKQIEEEEDQEPQHQSSHAISSNKLLKQTEELEREAIAEKPWQMTGESKGADRPTNSLLEATPEFEVANKMTPIITVEHTASIEDMIKKRILDEDWDDVVPRELPDIGLGKRKGELPEVSQEKSKLGLGELYEREYLKKVSGYDKDAVERETEEDKVKNEMKALFANLCSKLDALSNYHFAPRPVADEAEIRTVTTPAIAMEEALPIHVSDARGVAPEEIYGAKKGRESVIRGDNELDQTERKRLRNAKKAARRKARKAKLADEKLISRLQPGLGLNNPYEKRKLREELQMARASGKVTAGEIDANKDYTTSTKFFLRMQENVEDEVRGRGASEGFKRKRDNQEGSRKSSAFKL